MLKCLSRVASVYSARKCYTNSVGVTSHTCGAVGLIVMTKQCGTGTDAEKKLRSNRARLFSQPFVLRSSFFIIFLCFPVKTRDLLYDISVASTNAIK